MNPKKDTKILIIDDEPTICEVLSASLMDEGYRVKSEFNGISGFTMLKTFKPQIVLLDIWMPQSKINGMDFLKQAKEEFPETEIIMMSGHGNIESAVKATKLGALDFIEKPLSINKILILIKNILSLQKEKKEKQTLLHRLRENIAIIGASQSIKNLKTKITHLALNDFCVLIQGEVSTGKRLTAQNIHYLSQRKHEAFVEFNATKVPKDLMEVELFGCAKNTFKASPQEKKGKCDYARKGTLFINEITALNFEIQKKILNLIQESYFNRKNDQKPIQASIRVIASTQKNIKEEIEKKKFLPSLLEAFEKNWIQIPPLRERKEDLLPLMNHFGENFTRNSSYLNKKFYEEDTKSLKNYSWPGNLNELKNLVEKTFILPFQEIKKENLKEKNHQEKNNLETLI